MIGKHVLNWNWSNHINYFDSRNRTWWLNDLLWILVPNACLIWDYPRNWGFWIEWRVWVSRNWIQRILVNSILNWEWMLELRDQLIHVNEGLRGFQSLTLDNHCSTYFSVKYSSWFFCILLLNSCCHKNLNSKHNFHIHCLLLLLVQLVVTFEFLWLNNSPRGNDILLFTYYWNDWYTCHNFYHQPSI